MGKKNKKEKKEQKESLVDSTVSTITEQKEKVKCLPYREISAKLLKKVDKLVGKHGAEDVVIAVLDRVGILELKKGETE